jgi:hypothetical protein
LKPTTVQESCEFQGAPIEVELPINVPVSKEEGPLLYSDTVAAEKLSVAMQRCYMVIRDLMIHSQACLFTNPVESSVIPSYDKIVRKPLCLMEIRSFLVQGGYNNSIFSFYMDVIFLLENAMAFNPEGSNVKLAAQRLLIVFERMFLETVLSWDSSLTCGDSCATCRTMYPISDFKVFPKYLFVLSEIYFLI